MKASIASYINVDRIVHEPARLVILTVLAETDKMEFRFLEKISGLTKGNLSGHISKLEQAGYVEVDKFFRGKVPVTSLKITPIGRNALENYRKELNGALTHRPTILSAIRKRVRSLP